MSEELDGPEPEPIRPQGLRGLTKRFRGRSRPNPEDTGKPHSLPRQILERVERVTDYLFWRSTSS